MVEEYAKCFSYNFLAMIIALLLSSKNFQWHGGPGYCGNNCLA